MITRQFDLFLNKGVTIAPTINVNQYDHNEQWVFTLYQENGSVYTPLNSAIAGVKSDKKGIINSASVNNNGQVVVVETEQMTAAAGTAIYELVIDDGTHGTANFIVQVEPKPTDGAEISDSDYSYIQDSIDHIADVTAEVKSVVPVNIGTDGQVLTKRNEQSRWETHESLPSGGTDGQVLTRTGGGTSSSWQTVDTIPSGGSVGQVLSKTVSGPGWRSVDEVPSNGTNGQVLTKTSTGYGWDNIDALPSGGTSGQVLTKNSSTDGDASWRDQVGTVSSVNGITPDTNKNVQVDVELTQAQYDALPASKMSDNVNYFITDGLNHTTGVVSAENVIYDNTDSGMTATDVQSAVDELSNDLTHKQNTLTITSLTSTAVGSGVTINSQSMSLYGKVLQFSIDVTLASQISQYGNIVSLGGKSAAAGWCHPIFSAGFVPSSEKAIYGDSGNQHIRAAQAIPAGRYRFIGMILTT